MSVCRDRPTRLAAFAAAAVFGGAAAWGQAPPATTLPDRTSPAAATEGAPGPRGPATGAPPAPEGPPTVLAPAPRSLSPQPHRPLWTPLRRPGLGDASGGVPANGNSEGGVVAVEVDTLGEIDPDSVGVLSSEKGGLGADMWAGTTRRLVERLLPLIPGELRSPALRDLAVRMLLTRATAPAGERGPKSLLSIRVDRLLALGAVRGAVRLLRVGSIEEDDGVTSLVDVESRFIDNDNAGACQRVRSSGRRFEGVYWQQALSYCLALEGEIDRATMISDILRERADHKDQVFFKLVDLLGGQNGLAIDSLPDPLGLYLSMMRAANQKVPADVLETQNLAILRTVAFSPNADIDVRLRAAERLVLVGAVTPSELVNLYASLPPDSDASADADKADGAGWGPRARAAVVKAAMRAGDPKTKVDLLLKSWDVARERNGVAVMVRASVPLLRAIEPGPALMGAAREIGRALFAHGETKAAMGWLRLALARSATDPIAREAAVALWPLGRLAAAEDALAPEPARLRAWWVGLSADRPKTAAKTAVTVYRLLEAVGRHVGPEAWTALVGRPGAPTWRAPDSALWRALADASSNRRVGETTIYALIALGPGGTTAAEPAAVTTIISALQRAGLEKEARALAIEAAIAAGA